MFLLCIFALKNKGNSKTLLLLILRIFNSNLLPDLLHKFRQEKCLIQGDDRTFSQPLLETFTHMLSFVSEASRVREVEWELGLWIRIIE
jgi:hypothetical protein